MSISPDASLRDVVAAVASVLKKHHITATLTGGACASLHSRGEYQSYDLDFILHSRVTQLQLDQAMVELGFERVGAQYQHPDTPFFVEFPRGPLAIGDDDMVEPVEVRVGQARVWALSATDSCRDRLAAFYFWNDEQSLRAAAAIARRDKVDMDAILRWSHREGHKHGYQRFLQELARK
jgi:hypothetical protein